VLDTTLQAGAQLTDILNQMRQKALAASDATIDDPSRAQYASEFAKLGQSYANTIASATFNGVNLIDGGTGQVQALGSADGAITVNSAHKAIDLNSEFSTAKALTITAGSAVAGQTYFTADSVAMTANAWTGATGAADAGSDMALVDTALKTVTQTLSGFGVDSKAMDNQLTGVTNLQNSLNTGVGNLVDANLAQESASLQALQTKQQLGVQALSIANQSTSILLGLFR
jgi:flagellin